MSGTGRRKAARGVGRHKNGQKKRLDGKSTRIKMGKSVCSHKNERKEKGWRERNIGEETSEKNGEKTGG